MNDTDRYLAWIKENVKGDGYGDCAEVVPAMAKTFPELQVRKGFFHCLSWGRRQHWWLCREDGLIVDPTGAQHPTGFLVCRDRHGVRYEDLTDLPEEELWRRVPTGRCANCGGDAYNGDTVCSDVCHNEYAAYLQNPELG